MKPPQEASPVPIPTTLTKEFWASARQGKLVFQYCPDCKVFESYPKPWCSKCGSEELRWKEVSGKGMIYSYTIPRQVVDNSPAFDKKLPLVVAIVQLDEGPRLYSNIIGISPEQVMIGMKVQVVFEDVSADIALPMFQPMNSE